MNCRALLPFLLGLMLFSSILHAQEKKEAKDSLIRLIEASSAQLQEIDGVSYRKIIGPSARFLHNNTYLVCDTALWNVSTNVIKAIGNVQIIQENTFLTSDKIDYLIDKDLAQFRGSLVELFDKEGNVLRTNYLDYNTKDSIATFYAGGAMKNNNGNLIESQNGEYRSEDKTFYFRDNVQMFTDSVFIKSDEIDYNTVTDVAGFGPGTTAWQEDNMLFANNGAFDRVNNIFKFNLDSYILTKEQEIWADTLLYFRNTGVADLTYNIQILDTVQKSFCFADKAIYNPQPMQVELTKKPSVAMYTVEDGVRDTMFMAADTIKYYTIRYCDIDSTEILKANERIGLSNIDPLAKIEQEGAIRRKENEDAVNSPFIKGPKNKDKDNGKEKVKEKENIATTDSTAKPLAAADSLANTPVPPAQPDTTSVAFIDAWHKVKVYRNDLQALCDSLVYTGIDSMARMYIDPVMWNDVKHQFTADSMQIILKNNVLSKANLISNAFIASQEDSIHFNQIKGTEMVAYFKDNDLYRYDALGGASMIFYVEEDSTITMMNQKEGKIISASLQNREIQRIKYFENLKNNLIPTYNLPIEDQRLRGFIWRGDERPLSRKEVVDRDIKRSQRVDMAMKSFPDYPYAGKYFSTTRDSILQYKAYSDSLRFAKELAKIREKELEREKQRRDSLDKATNMADSLRNATHAHTDSTANAPTAAHSSISNTDTEEIALLKSELDHLAKLSKEERKVVKREQKALRKKIKQENKALRKLEKQLHRAEKKGRR